MNRKILYAVGDRLLRYVYKNPRRNLVKLVKVGKLVAGKMFPPSTFTKPIEIIEDEDNVWHQFLFRGLDEVDPALFRRIALTFAIDLGYFGTKALRANREKEHCNIPWVVLMDPTSACNLHCTGCWAAEYGNRLNLSFEDMDRIVTQGKELGIYLYFFTGGEPLVRKDDIIRLCEKHDDCGFHAFTNGTLIDEKFCQDMKRVGNFSVAISLEGFNEVNDLRRGKGVFDKVMHAMDLMKQYGLIFGTSICYTSKNYKVVTSDEFLDMIIEKGARFSWYFHYMPVGNEASCELLPDPDQREYMYHRVREIRGFTGGKQIFAFDFQNDGEYVGGCIAGGRNYFHINANGDAEPCVFIHYSSANIKEVSVLDALRQPLFMAYHNNQPFNKNHLRPCPMLENPEKLQQMVHETGAKSTDLQSPESVEHLCGKCEQYASIWKEKADELWEKSGKAEKEEKKA